MMQLSGDFNNLTYVPVRPKGPNTKPDISLPDLTVPDLTVPDTFDTYFENHNQYLKGLQDNTQNAYDAVSKYYQNMPAAYVPSQWRGKADKAMAQYLNRDPYQYDINSDALYEQYKDQYIKQGQMAMMDTMGQAAAMTGGYGNSYAQSIGQQAYNQQLDQLNAVVPELYGMAYDRYAQEGQDILNQYSLYADREAQEYEQYQRNLNNWISKGQQLSDNYTTAAQQFKDATTYREASIEEQKRIEDKFADAENIDTLKDLVDQYEALGYDPAWIYKLASTRDRALK